MEWVIQIMRPSPRMFEAICTGTFRRWLTPRKRLINPWDVARTSPSRRSCKKKKKKGVGTHKYFKCKLEKKNAKFRTS